MIKNAAVSISREESDKRFQLFKFYEEAAQRAKSDAWTQTTWVLTLSGGILAFSMKLYIDHCKVPALPIIAWACAFAGLLLSAYIVYVLHQLAKHIRTYWTAANRLAAPDEFLSPYIDPDEADAARSKEGYRACYPPFVLRLFVPPIMFAVGHLVWAIYAAQHLCA